MRAYELKAPAGARKSKKRVGRGNSSGHGTYSTKGQKGQKARAGGGTNRAFEGGQTRIVKRLPELRGFTNNFKIYYSVVNLRKLEANFAAGAEVTAQALADLGLIPGSKQPLKVLGDGELTKAMTVHAVKFSEAAKAKIVAAGGRAEETASA